MNFFKKLFGKNQPAGNKPAAPPAQEGAAQPAIDPAKDPNLIKVFDAYGQEMFLTKEAWRKDVLPTVNQRIDFCDCAERANLCRGAAPRWSRRTGIRE